MKTIALLLALGFTTPLIGEVAIVRYQGQSFSLVVVQANPIDPDPHPDAPTFNLDGSGFDVGAPDARIGNPTGGQVRLPSPPVSPAWVQANPFDPDPHPDRIRQWTSFLRLDTESVLNPLGDDNGDGPASLGTAHVGLQNPPTVAWAKQVGLGNHDPVYAQFTGGAWSAPVVISASPADDVDPMWHQDGGGIVHSVWRRQTSPGVWQVLHASLAPGGTTFSAEEPVSLGAESGRSATLAVLSTGEVLVAYEISAGDGLRQVIVASKADAGSAFHGAVIATSSFAGTEPELRSKLGRTWVTWIDSADRIAYRELVDGVWSAVEYEAFVGLENAGKARMSIQARLVRQAVSSAPLSTHGPDRPATRIPQVRPIGSDVHAQRVVDTREVSDSSVSPPEVVGAGRSHAQTWVYRGSIPFGRWSELPIAALDGRDPGQSLRSSNRVGVQANPSEPDPHPDRHAMGMGDSESGEGRPAGSDGSAADQARVSPPRVHPMNERLSLARERLRHRCETAESCGVLAPPAP